MSELLKILLELWVIEKVIGLVLLIISLLIFVMLIVSSKTR